MAMIEDIRHFPTLFVRKINPRLGNSPNIDVFARNAAYLTRHGQPFLITRMYKSHVAEEPYSELRWWLTEEIRMLASINLSRSYGCYWFTIDTKPIRVEYDQIEPLVKTERFPLTDVVDSVLDWVYPCSENSCPIGNELSNFQMGTYTPKQFYNVLHPDNVHLYRCLSLWLKAGMLANYEPFREEACTMLYFALEGILKLFHEEVRLKHPNIPFLDAIAQVTSSVEYHEAFNSYLRDCYANRVMLVHPMNNFGDYITVPLIADDLLETFEVFRDLAFLYITGHTLDSC